MRRASCTARHLSMIVASLVCGCNDGCDSAPNAMYAWSADEACEDLSCPLAVGAETRIFMAYDGRIDEVLISPPELATLEYSPESSVLTVTPQLAGIGTLIARSAGGGEWPLQDIETADIQSTTCVALAAYKVWDGTTMPVYPDGTQQLYASTMMRVVALHRDANGGPLLGHGVEDWSIEGGTVAAAGPWPDELTNERDLLDGELTRVVLADARSEIRITARPQDPAFVLRVQPPGAAVTLALEGINAELHLDDGTEIRPRLDVFDAEGRYVHGIPGNTEVDLEVADPAVLTVASIWGRRMYLRGVRAGTTTLTIRFDGREVSYPVRVH